MAGKHWVAGAACALALLLASPAVAAVSTVPDLPGLSSAVQGESGADSTAGAPAAAPTEPESGAAASSPAPAEETGGNRLLFIGIGAWAGFLAAVGVVAVILFRGKKRPPGGGDQGGTDSAAYKERLLSDQHYRRY